MIRPIPQRHSHAYGNDPLPSGSEAGRRRVINRDVPAAHDRSAVPVGGDRPGRLKPNGRMRIIDRGGLEAAACECHEIVRREFDRLSGSTK